MKNRLASKVSADRCVSVTPEAPFAVMDEGGEAMHRS
jgi:hypothetical protein